MITFNLVTADGAVWATVSVRADGWRSAGRMLAVTYPTMIITMV